MRLRKISYPMYRSLMMGIYSSVYFSFLKPISKNKRALMGLVILIGFFLMATIGPEAVPLKLITDRAERYKLPSFEHPLGTDFAGRDLFQQIVHGSREVLTVAFFTALYAIIIALVLGLISGYVGGFVDEAITAMTDVFLTIPNFPIMLMIAATIRITDPLTFAAVLAVWLWAGLARSIRAQVGSLKQRQYIEAARSLNLGLRHIIFREIAPHILPYIAINFITIISAAVTASVGMLYLGVVPFTITHWGAMLNLAMSSQSLYVPQGIFYVSVPIIFIMLLEFGAVNFAHGLEEVFNPRLKRYE